MPVNSLAYLCSVGLVFPFELYACWPVWAAWGWCPYQFEVHVGSHACQSIGLSVLRGLVFLLNCTIQVDLKGAMGCMPT